MRRVNLFIKYMINNILILTLPVLFFFLFYYVSYGNTQAQIDRYVEGELDASIETYQKFFDEVNTMFTQLTMDYMINHYLGLQGNIEGVPFYNLKDISLKLAPYVNGNPLLSHVILYFEKSDFLVSDVGFSRHDKFYGTLFSTGSGWEKWIREVKKNGTRFLPYERINMNKRSFVGHFYIKSIGTSHNYRGAIIAVLDLEDLKTPLSHLPARFGGCFFMENSQGIVASSDEREDLISEGILIRTDGGYELGGRNYQLYQKATKDGDFTFTAVLDKRRIFADLFSLRRLALILLGSVFLIGAAVSFFLARNNSRPITRIFDMILPEEGEDTGKVSLYEKVENALLESSDRYSRLETEVQEQKEFLRPYVLQKLISGNYKSRGHLNEELVNTGIKSDRSPLCIMTCRLPDIYLTGEQSNPLNRYSILAAAVENNLGAEGYRIPMAFGGLTFLIRIPDPDRYRAHCSTLVDRILAGLNKGDRRDISFGVSRICYDLFQLSQSYRESLDSMSVLPHEMSASLSFYEDVLWDNSHYIYPINTEQDLMKAVVTGNMELIRSHHLALRTDNFIDRRLSMRELDNLFIQMQGTLIRLTTSLPENDSTDWDREIKKWSSLSSSLEKWDAILELLEKIGHIYESGKKSHNTKLIEEINLFIQNNYMNHDLGLTLIAERFGISENYLSNLYKEQTSQRISAYIQSIRMEKAKEYLKRKSMSVSDASLLCGYTNVSSFRRAFKRETGFSPNQFRD